MKKKKNNHTSQFAIFPISSSNDPLSNILGVVGNVVVGAGAEWLNREFRDAIGLPQTSLHSQIELSRAKLQLAKQEADTTRAKALSEMEVRYLDLKIKQKEVEIEQKTLRLEKIKAEKSQITLPVIPEVISGALEVTANPDGIIGSPDGSEGYVLWLDSFEGGKVTLILGRRGSGKTALAAKIGEYMMATHRMPVYWIGLPEQARSLLPRWITLVDSPNQCPVGCLIIIDEGGLHFLSLAFATDQNRLLRALLMVCRQRHSSLVVAVQSSRDLEYSVVRQADSIIFREPGMHQPDSERPDIRPMAKKAAAIFKEIPQDEKKASAFVFDDNFTGVIKCTLPSFWSEELSHIYAHFDLTSM